MLGLGRWQDGKKDGEKDGEKDGKKESPCACFLIIIKASLINLRRRNESKGEGGREGRKETEGLISRSIYLFFWYNL